MAVGTRVEKMLGDPPWFVADPAVETFNRRFPSVARIDIDCHQMFAEPGEKFRIDLWSQILSRRVLGSCFKFRLEFGVLCRVKFQEQSPGIFECDLVCGR